MCNWNAISNEKERHLVNFQYISKKFRKNDTSFECLDIELLESGNELGLVSSWGWPCPLNSTSTTFTRNHLKPLIMKIPPVSKLLSKGLLYKVFTSNGLKMASHKSSKSKNSVWIKVIVNLNSTQLKNMYIVSICENKNCI